MVRIPLNDSRRDTALNVAVYGGSITCEEGLVNNFGGSKNEFEDFHNEVCGELINWV